MSCDDWYDINLLDDNNKNLISKYFKDSKGKYMIDNNILQVYIESWGIEKFYIYNSLTQNYYNIKYENINEIYDIAISIQIGNWDIFKSMEIYFENFNNININYYFILIDYHATENNIDYLINSYKNSVIISTENKGMDIGLFLINIMYMKIKKYTHKYIIKVHTKTNDNFRNESLNNLIGSEEIITNNIRKLNDENNGIISGNRIYKYNEFKDAFIQNYYYLEKLIKYIYNENVITDRLEFSAGTMFIAKNEIFNIFNIPIIEYIYNNLNNYDSLDYYWYSVYYKLNINNKKQILEDYNNNKDTKYPNNINYCIRTNRGGLRDCMMEHAVERLFGYMCKKLNLEIIN